MAQRLARVASFAAGSEALAGPVPSAWLTPIRLAWVGLAALILALWIAGLPVLVERIARGCAPAAPCPTVGLPLGGEALGAGFTPLLYASISAAADGVLGAVYLVVAALLLWRGADRRMTVFSAFALLLFGGVTFTDVVPGLVRTLPSLVVPGVLLDILGRASFTTFLFVFPDGRFVPRWTRWVALLWIGVQATGAFRGAGLLPEWSQVVGMLNVTGGVLGLPVAAVGQAYRYRRVSDPNQRQQTRWTAFGFVLAVGIYFVQGVSLQVFPWMREPLPALGDQVVANAAIAVIPLTVAAALLWHRLFDVDALIGRTLVYTALTASVVGIYVLVVGYLGTLFRTDDNLAVSLLATGAAAVLFQPIRERLQRAVNRLLYGQRDEPYAVLAALGQQMDFPGAAGSALLAVVDTTARALKLPYVAIRLPAADGASVEAAATGTPVEGVLRQPLEYQGQTVGELVLGRRGRSESFTAADRRLLRDLARQAGAAVHAAEQTAELQRARVRLVSAREEERRRLRRDLHDGLGPTLAALTLKLETARNLLGADSRADALLAGLSQHAQAAITDIRRLVYDLRPPALDDLGLLGAVRQTAGTYDVPGSDGLKVEVTATELPRSLPAAVEVAAYRIATEALVNVVRHARATRCTMSFTEEGACLRIDVEDDGVGLPEPVRPGVGLASMRERAEELGGSCTVTSSPIGGVRVTALLPLPLPEPAALAPEPAPLEASVGS